MKCSSKRICCRLGREAGFHPANKPYYNHPSMKILLINQVFVSPEEPGHTRHFEMAQFLQARGHELVIVASDLNYQTGQKTVERKGIFARQVIDGVQILRAYMYPALHRSYLW